MVTGSNQLISPSARWNKGNGVEGERTVSGLGGGGGEGEVTESWM